MTFRARLPTRYVCVSRYADILWRETAFQQRYRSTSRYHRPKVATVPCFAHLETSGQGGSHATYTIAGRAELVLGSKQAGDDIRDELKHRLDYWLAQAARKTGGSRLGYQEKKDGLTRGLLKKPTLGSWEDFSCLNSLREVEPSVNLVIDNGTFDDEPTVAPPVESSGGLSS